MARKLKFSLKTATVNLEFFKNFKSFWNLGHVLKLIFSPVKCHLYPDFQVDWFIVYISRLSLASPLKHFLYFFTSLVKEVLTFFLLLFNSSSKVFSHDLWSRSCTTFPSIIQNLIFFLAFYFCLLVTSWFSERAFKLHGNSNFWSTAQINIQL